MPIAQPTPGMGGAAKPGWWLGIHPCGGGGKGGGGGGGGKVPW